MGRTLNSQSWPNFPLSTCSSLFINRWDEKLEERKVAQDNQKVCRCVFTKLRQCSGRLTLTRRLNIIVRRWIFLIRIGVSQNLKMCFVNIQSSQHCILCTICCLPLSLSFCSHYNHFAVSSTEAFSVFIPRSLNINAQKCCSDWSHRFLPSPGVKWQLLSASYLQLWRCLIQQWRWKVNPKGLIH